MEPTGDDDEFAVIGPIHQAVLVVDAARPVPGEVAAKGLRFANALERAAGGGFDQQVDALQGLLVFRLPVEVGLRASQKE